MKKYLIITLFAFLFNAHSAQEQNREKYVNQAQVEELCQLGNHAALLAREGYRPKDNKNLFTLHYLDKMIPTQELTLPKGSRLYAAESTMSTGALIFNSNKEVTIVYVAPNKAAQYVTIPTEKGYDHYAISYSDVTKDGKLVLIRNYNQFKMDGSDKINVEAGMEYLYLDNNGVTTNRRLDAWTSKTSYSVINSFATTNGMAFLQEAKKTSFRDYLSRLILCNAAGEITGEYKLNNDDFTYFPSDLIHDDGKYVVAGDYLKGDAFTAKRTEGLFLTILTPAAQIQGSNMFNWDNLKVALRDSKRGDFMFSGKVNVVVEAIVNNGAGYSILGESFNKGGGKTGTEMLLGGNDSKELVITVMDFILFDTDLNANLTSVQILEKDQCNIMMNGTNKKMRITQMSRMLKKYNVFPFRSFDNGMISFINYKNQIGTLSELNVSTKAITDIAPIELEIVEAVVVDVDEEAMIANSKTLTKLDNMNKKIDATDSKLDKLGNKLNYSIGAIDLEFNRGGNSQKGLFFLNSGKVLSYKWDGSGNSVYYQYLN